MKALAVIRFRDHRFTWSRLNNTILFQVEALMLTRCPSGEATESWREVVEIRMTRHQAELCAATFYGLAAAEDEPPAGHEEVRC